MELPSCVRDRTRGLRKNLIRRFSYMKTKVMIEETLKARTSDPVLFDVMVRQQPIDQIIPEPKVMLS